MIRPGNEEFDRLGTPGPLYRSPVVTAQVSGFEGVGLAAVVAADGDEIAALVVYLDYSALLVEVPDDVPDVHERTSIRRRFRHDCEIH